MNIIDKITILLYHNTDHELRHYIERIRLYRDTTFCKVYFIPSNTQSH